MRLIVLLVGVTLLLACAGSRPPLVAAPEYLGLQHPSLPAGHAVLTGYMLDPQVERGFAVEHVRHGARELLLLSRGLGHDSVGQMRWEIIDAVVLPQRDSSLVVALGTCGRGSGPTPDVEVVAFVRGDAEQEVWREVRVAWRADRTIGRITSETIAGLRCINEGYGV